MKRIAVVATLMVALVLTFLPLRSAVHADVPTALAFTVNPSVFGFGATASTQVCMTQQTNPPVVILKIVF